MKLFKYTVYVLDHENIGQQETEYLLTNVKYLFNSVFFNGEAEIGEWEDDHELNQSGTDQLTFDKYFDK